MSQILNALRHADRVLFDVYSNAGKLDWQEIETMCKLACQQTRVALEPYPPDAPPKAQFAWVQQNPYEWYGCLVLNGKNTRASATVFSEKPPQWKVGLNQFLLDCEVSPVAYNDLDSAKKAAEQAVLQRIEVFYNAIS